MPEGHTLHRLARNVDRRFRRAVVTVSSPQGRFAAGAQRLDGTRLVGARAHGKHLLVRFAPPDAPPPLRRRPAGAPVDGEQTLHVHLGLYGTFVLGAGEPPPVRGALRLRLVGVPEDGAGEEAAPWGDLRGPTACELLEPGEVEALEARLGPDPLQPDPAGAGRAAFVARTGASRSAVGGLLMRQDLVAGIGNVYRAEALFRAGVHPEVPGRSVGDAVLGGMWDDLVVLMRSGVRTGRIVTTEPEHRIGPGPGARGRSGGRAGWRDVAHYVYRRQGLPCRVCGTPVETAVMVGRNVFWCPVCQPA